MSDVKFTYPDVDPPAPGDRRGYGTGLMLLLGFQGLAWFGIGWWLRGFFP